MKFRIVKKPKKSQEREAVNIDFLLFIYPTRLSITDSIRVDNKKTDTVLKEILNSSIKKQSRTSPEIQSKELTEKHRSTLHDQQIYWTLPAKTQTESSNKV